MKKQTIVFVLLLSVLLTFACGSCSCNGPKIRSVFCGVQPAENLTVAAAGLKLNASADEILRMFSYGETVMGECYNGHYFSAVVLPVGKPLAPLEAVVLVDEAANATYLCRPNGEMGVELGLLACRDGSYDWVDTSNGSAQVRLIEDNGDTSLADGNWFVASASDKRSDYADLDDDAFANFLPVVIPNIPQGILYSSSSPTNLSGGRDAYADKACKNAHIRTILNLTDVQDAAERIGHDYDRYSWEKDVFFCEMPDIYTSEQFRSKLAEGLRFMIHFEGPYLICDSDGTVCSGLVCALLEAFMDASVQDIQMGYTARMQNRYNVTDGTHMPLSDFEQWLCNENIENMLAAVFGERELDYQNLSSKAADYLRSIGLTDEELGQLRERLSGK